MDSPLSRAAAIQAANITASRSEAARYLEAAEDVLRDLISGTSNGERSIFQGIRSRLEADRRKLTGEDEREGESEPQAAALDPVGHGFA